MLAGLSRGDSVFFAPKKPVSGLVYLRRRALCPCSMELLNLIHMLLVILITELSQHLYWVVLCGSRLGNLCVLKRDVEVGRGGGGNLY